MTMRRRITRLEEKLPPPAPDETLRQKRWEIVWVRLIRQLEQGAALLSPEEEQAAGKVLADLADDKRFDDDGLGAPYACWLRDLEDGWCRLPKLPPAAMKDLLVAWSSPGVPHGNGPVVLRHDLVPVRAVHRQEGRAVEQALRARSPVDRSVRRNQEEIPRWPSVVDNKRMRRSC
jgi:hypothetical protein